MNVLCNEEIVVGVKNNIENEKNINLIELQERGFYHL